MPARTHRVGQRRPSQVDRLHLLLLDGAWHTTRELRRKVGENFGVAMHQLRARGYRIERTRHWRRAYDWQYRLLEYRP